MFSADSLISSVMYTQNTAVEMIEESEAFITQTCSECNERETTHQDKNLFWYGLCEFEGIVDLKTNRVFPI